MKNIRIRLSSLDLLLCVNLTYDSTGYNPAAKQAAILPEHFKETLEQVTMTGRQHTYVGRGKYRHEKSEIKIIRDGYAVYDCNNAAPGMRDVHNRNRTHFNKAGTDTQQGGVISPNRYLDHRVTGKNASSSLHKGSIRNIQSSNPLSISLLLI